MASQQNQRQKVLGELPLPSRPLDRTVLHDLLDGRARCGRVDLGDPGVRADEPQTFTGDTRRCEACAQVQREGRQQAARADGGVGVGAPVVRAETLDDAVTAGTRRLVERIRAASKTGVRVDPAMAVAGAAVGTVALPTLVGLATR